MGRQQPIRVVVEKRGAGPSGCGTTLAVMVLLGLTIEYWYVALGIAALVILAMIANSRTQRRPKQAPPRPGPRDPWLNAVAVALADLELTEIARNTGTHLGGAPMDADLGVQAAGFLVYVNLFSDQRLAEQAELGLRAQPEVRDAMAKGTTAIRAADRLVFVAKGRGGVLDDFRLDEVARVTGRIAVPPPLQHARSAPEVQRANPDVLEQLRKLGDLRAAEVLTDAEFAAKKAELLGRL